MTMPLRASQPIDDYASSMFRFELLNDAWIDRCATYLQHIFGERLHGKTVIDYAFGRGNWSVAFIRAGAANVIAIDASISNVRRFKRYCSDHKLAAIEVLCANVLESPIDCCGNILWLYGILQHITNQQLFLKAILKLVPAEDALVLAYGYDAGSVREWIVERCRAVLQYRSEAEFRRDSLKFTPAARLRARDDLTVPHVHWYTAASMAQEFSALGWNPVKQVDDFRIVDMGYSEAEFAPIHILFARHVAKAVSLREPAHIYSDDLKILDALWAALLPRLDEAARQDLAIATFNTHFSHLGAKGEIQTSLLQLALLLLYGLNMREVKPEQLTGLAAQMLALCNAAIGDASRPSPTEAKQAFITQYLMKHTVRI